MVKHFETELELIVAIPSVLIGLLGIGIAYVMYKKETAIPDKLAATFKYSYKWAYNKFYMDEVISFCYQEDNLQIYFNSDCMVRQAYC